MQLKRYKRFIFDFDGVIADSNHIKEVAIKKASLIVKNKELRDDFINFFVNNNGLTREFKIFKYFGEQEGMFVLKNYEDLLKKTFYSCPLIEGIENFLGQLKSLNKNLIILSGANENEVRKYLIQRNLIDKFEVVLGGPESKKSNFEKLSYEEKTVFFGDSKLDYDLAKNYKLDFVFVYGASAMKSWKTELNFSNNFSYIKNFGEIKNV